MTQSSRLFCFCGCSMFNPLSNCNRPGIKCRHSPSLLNNLSSKNAQRHNKAHAVGNESILIKRRQRSNSSKLESFKFLSKSLILCVRCIGAITDFDIIEHVAEGVSRVVIEAVTLTPSVRYSIDHVDDCAIILRLR